MQVELVRVGQVGRQRLVEIVEGEVALFFGQLDQFANPRLRVARRRWRRISHSCPRVLRYGHLIAALLGSRAADFFRADDHVPRLVGGVSRETSLRGRPRGRLAFATTFALCVFFLSLGGRPRFWLRAAALVGFFSRADVFDFFAKTMCC